MKPACKQGDCRHAGNNKSVFCDGEVTANEADGVFRKHLSVARFQMAIHRGANVSLANKTGVLWTAK